MLRSGCEREGGPNTPIGPPSLQACPGFTVVARFRRVRCCPSTKVPIVSKKPWTVRMHQKLSTGRLILTE